MQRSTWNGSISFGLANVPVKLYTSTIEGGTKLNLVTKTGTPVSMVRMARGRYVEWADVYRGAKVGDSYIVLDPAELDALRPDRSKTIEIERFVSADEIDPYVIKEKHIAGPDKGGAKWYGLLRAILREQKVVGIGRVVMSNRERLVAVALRGDAIVMLTLAYAEDLNDPQPLLSIDGEIPEPDTDTLKQAAKLVKAMGGKFDHTAIEDTYRRDVEKLIDSKSKAPKRGRRAKASQTPANDLSAALSASIEAVKPKRGQKVNA